MILTPDEARDYLRVIPEEFGDDEANRYITAAETYLTNAGCVLNANDELAKLAVRMLVVDYYENRDPNSRSAEVMVSSTKIDVGLKSIITQLQLAGDAT